MSHTMTLAQLDILGDLCSASTKASGPGLRPKGTTHGILLLKETSSYTCLITTPLRLLLTRTIGMSASI